MSSESERRDKREKPPRDILQQRIARLETLRAGNRKIGQEVQGNLARWAGPDCPDMIAMRAGYIRRLTPLQAGVDYDPALLVDRPKPHLPDSPPLADLTPLTKGIAQQLSLTLIFLAQTQPRRTLGKDGLLKIAIEGTDSNPVGLVDLIAVPGAHRPAKNTPFVSNFRENRKRQIRNGFVQMDERGLATLPTGGRKGAPRFNTVHLNEDSRPHASGRKAYTRPRSTTNVVTVPTAFFVNGWIHALSKSEIAMWLMLRDLAQRTDQVSAPNKLQIRGSQRLLEYDLSRAVWDTHCTLEDFGLIAVHKDPNRRPNGTTLDGGRAEPHHFELLDDGLEADGLTTVLNELVKRRQLKSR